MIFMPAEFSDALCLFVYAVRVFSDLCTSLLLSVAFAGQIAFSLEMKLNRI